MTKITVKLEENIIHSLPRRKHLDKGYIDNICDVERFHHEVVKTDGVK